MKGTRETRGPKLGSQKLCLNQGRQWKVGKKASQQEGLAKGSSGSSRSRPLGQLLTRRCTGSAGACSGASPGGLQTSPRLSLAFALFGSG